MSYMKERAIEDRNNAEASVPASGWEQDEARWALVEEALLTPDLKSDLARLSAISVTVQSRKPPTEADIARTQALAEKYGWLPAPPALPED